MCECVLMRLSKQASPRSCLVYLLQQSRGSYGRKCPDLQTPVCSSFWFYINELALSKKIQNIYSGRAGLCVTVVCTVYFTYTFVILIYSF